MSEEEIEKLLISRPKVVGTRQVLKGIASDELRCVVMSEDADEALKEKIVAMAQSKNLEIHTVKSMVWLGKVSEVAVKTAVVGILKS